MKLPKVDNVIYTSQNRTLRARNAIATGTINDVYILYLILIDKEKTVSIDILYV